MRRQLTEAQTSHSTVQAAPGFKVVPQVPPTRVKSPLVATLSMVIGLDA